MNVLCNLSFVNLSFWIHERVLRVELVKMLNNDSP